MRRSLSTRLMYSFMTVIVIIVVGVTAGLSFIITDYFYKDKEQELAEKGNKISSNIEYLLRASDRNDLYRYMLVADRLVGARIWLFNRQYELMAVSHAGRESEGEDAKFIFNNAIAQVNKALQEETAMLHEEIKSGNLSDKVREILNDIYAGNSVKSQIYHPYYKEHVILVGVPYTEPYSNEQGAILMTEALSGFDRFMRNIYIYTVVVGIIALIFSLFLVRSLSGVIVKPFIDMAESAAAIASGDYTKHIEVTGDDKIAELGTALNSLSSNLEDYMQKMEKTEKIRRDFVANVSHELRTPITIIRGYNEVISENIVTDQNMIQRYRRLINEETVRLERMVRELLDISRLEASEALTAKNMEELPLAAVVRNAVEKVMVNGVANNIKFSVHVNENIKILGNGDQMMQLVMILADNALKYSPENGTVSLGAKKLEDGSVMLTVSDEGPGIPEEDIPFIWERFYKVDKSHNRNVSGTGLGLAIAKEIIRMHGAEAEIISRPGEGTRFEIKFLKDKVINV